MTKPGPKPIPMIERFEEKYMPEPMSGCWLWIGATGGRKGSGYGRFWDGERYDLVHRISYRYFNGAIPDGCIVDHKCDNSSCVNPKHLQTISQSNNVLRGVRLKSHCKHGHEYTKENTTIKRDGSRSCRACRHIQYIRARARLE